MITLGVELGVASAVKVEVDGAVQLGFERGDHLLLLTEQRVLASQLREEGQRGGAVVNISACLACCVCCVL